MSKFFLLFLKRFFDKCGFILIKARKNYHYVPDYYGKSAEKRIDIRTIPVFHELAQKVLEDNNTLLYYDKLYIIFQLLKNLFVIYINNKNISDYHFAEVGVYKGGSSYFIASFLETMNMKNSKFYCFDTFEGHKEVDLNSKIETKHTTDYFKDTDYSLVCKYLKRFKNVKIFKGRIQDQCSHVNDKKFVFVHLDVDLYDPTLFSLFFFDKLLMSGGMIVIDDYQVLSCPGVVSAIDLFLKSHKNYYKIHPMTEQCILIKI